MAVAARITAPTLVITGRRTGWWTCGRRRRSARLIPDSRLMVLDNVGHVAQMECRDGGPRRAGLLDEAAATARADPAAGVDGPPTTGVNGLPTAGSVALRGDGGDAPECGGDAAWRPGVAS